MGRRTFLEGTSGRGRRRLRPILIATTLVGLGSIGLLGIELARLSWIPSANGEALSTPQPGGALVIGGGGKLPDEVIDRFRTLAGGAKARLVVIPTAAEKVESPDQTELIRRWKDRGFESVAILHTFSRARADDPTFVAPLRQATGVWLGGGRQTVLAETYSGTAVERELSALLDRGGVIGGTSAGAAVMSRVMIAGGRGEATLARGFDLLPGAIIDQHFLKRNRVKRLLGAVSKNPDRIGFGIDEQTALVVGVRTRRLTVLGNSYVLACIPARSGQPARLEILKRGDQVDLATLRDVDTPIPSPIELDTLLASDPH